jgi:hypothetical protein
MIATLPSLDTNTSPAPNGSYAFDDDLIHQVWCKRPQPRVV